LLAALMPLLLASGVGDVLAERGDAASAPFGPASAAVAAMLDELSCRGWSMACRGREAWRVKIIEGQREMFAPLGQGY
jgi:hypothetical protein